MTLIVSVLILIAAALLFPEGTRAFVVFVVKATCWVAIAGSVLFVILLGVGALKASSLEPVHKVSTHAVREWLPARVITLDDGTKIDVSAGWSDE